METLLIAVILALIPVLSWFIQYHLAKIDGKLKLFEKHLSVYYFDWVFVVFNLLWIYSVSFNYFIIVFSLIVSLIVTSLIHIFWKKLHIKEKKPVYMYDLKKRKITPAGVWHFLYHFIQLFLIIVFLLSDVSNIYSYLALFCLFLFFVGATFSSKSIHGKVSLTDWPFLILGFIIFFIKFFRILI